MLTGAIFYVKKCFFDRKRTYSTGSSIAATNPMFNNLSISEKDKRKELNSRERTPDDVIYESIQEDYEDPASSIPKSSSLYEGQDSKINTGDTSWVEAGYLAPTEITKK